MKTKDASKTAIAKRMKLQNWNEKKVVKEG